MTDAKAKPERQSYTNGLVAIAVPSGHVTRPIFGKHGFAGGALVVDWPAIVGSAVAGHTLPLGIRFPPKERTDGTLAIKVDSGAFAVEIQHLEPLILERINGYFGWKAVARLKLRQGPLPEAPKAKASPAPPPAGTESPARASLDKVEDPELRAVLERLGQRLAQRKS